MRFSTNEDIEAPVGFCFEQLSDFDALERIAMRRGAEVARLDPSETPAVGATWDIRFVLRGRKRRLMTRLVEHDPPNLIRFEARSDTFEGGLRAELIALSRQRTRIGIVLDLKPRTIPARLLIQSARLTRNRLDRRYKKRVAAFLAEIEMRHQRACGAV